MAVKATATLKYKTVNDVAGTKNFPNVNPAYVAVYDSDVSSSNATKIKTACRTLNSLTTNTYVGVNLTTEIDITDFESGDYNA